MKNKIAQIEPHEQLLSPLLDPVFKSVFTSDTEESRFALKDLISTYIGRA